MKIYIVLDHIDGVNQNSCGCKAFADKQQACAYAKKQIDSFIKEYDGDKDSIDNCFDNCSDDFFTMRANKTYIDIVIVEQELEVKTDTDNFVPDIIEVQVTDIEWDTDGDEEVLASLPQEMTIEVDLQDELSEAVSDAISTQVGYCHKGFKMSFNK